MNIYMHNKYISSSWDPKSTPYTGLYVYYIIQLKYGSAPGNKPGLGVMETAYIPK